MKRLGDLSETYTDGWALPVAHLPNNGPHLEIWMDRYTAHGERIFYAGFFSRHEPDIRNLVKQARKEWPVVLELGDEDVAGKRIFRMKKPLPASKFNAPVAEYYDGYHYFGFYDRMKGAPEQIEARFCRQAVDFFLDVIHQLPESDASDRDEEVYPRVERAVVRSHLTRERSRYLASQCKDRDNYECQVCGMKYEEEYGPLGRGFAESHHKKALATLKPSVPTKLEDLLTVCANCHRMLHRMEGKADDIRKLKAIVRRLRG